MKIIDLHCDTMMWHLKNDSHSLQDENRHINEEKLKTGKALAQCFALFVPAEGGNGFEEQIEDCYRRYHTLFQFYRNDLKDNSDWLSEARNADDIRKNEEEGKISAILTLEDGTFIGDRIERLEEAYECGARMLGLTWNTENKIGYPNDRDYEKHKLGLKPFGFEVIDRMEQMGMIVDVSHLSEGGFWDVVRASKKPFVASHSCARQLCDHQRNLSDSQLRAVGERGGVVGMNYLPAFVSHDAQKTRIEDVVRHICHMVNVAGIETVAFGSDFDGMGDAEVEFGDYGGYQEIVGALSRIFPESQMKKICYENAMRVFGECWK